MVLHPILLIELAHAHEADLLRQAEQHRLAQDASRAARRDRPRRHRRGAALTDPPAPGAYRIDPAHSTVTFATRHLFGLGAVHGSFALHDGDIQVTDPVRDTTVHARVAAGSFHTGSTGRDKAVRSARLLDAGAYPDITFASDRLEVREGRWVLHGVLGVREATSAIAVRVDTSHDDGSELRLRAGTRVDRYQFGITAARGLAARHVDLQFDVLARRS